MIWPTFCRLSTVVAADKIFVMDRGQVIEVSFPHLKPPYRYVNKMDIKIIGQGLVC